MKKLKLRGLINLSVFIVVLFITSCGDSGGSDAKITPLSETDDSTITGTYRITSMDYYFTTGEHFTSTELDFFSGMMTMDIAADLMTFELEWRDSQYGNFYDYDEYSISGSEPNATWDDAYYNISGKYTVIFYYDNYCSEGHCADVTMQIQKISDNVQSLLGKGALKKSVNKSFNELTIIAETVRSTSF